LLDSGEREWLVYFVMTYVEGPTLREHLARASRLSVPETIRLASDLLDALEHAHAHGIVHRDVKPDNVVLTSRGAVLLDFGIARAVAASGSDRLTRSGIAVGTSTYMSPEQITALKEIDHRSDIYSLGAMLFECLASQPPFSHRNEAVVLQLHLTQPAPDVRTLRPETPPELAGGIARALLKTPDERWQSAAAMRDALAAVGV
jgi:serine/threonine-protein kinase